ncbi:MAG: tetratricopeptide repeat protein [Oscillospiraceae bacterium]|nr:tetratricopeptide repeat protein [Oscillospiraceae bacterium]
MRKWILNAVIIILFLAIAALFVYDHIILDKPIENNIVRMVLIVASLVITLIRINRPNQESPLWFIEKVYKENLGEAFKSKPALRKKLVSATKLFHEEKYFKANEKFENLLKKCETDADFSVVYCFTAICHERTGLLEEAKDYYEKSLQYDPYNVSAYNNMATILKDEGKVEEAIIYLKRAIDINPEYLNGYHNLAGIYLDLFDLEKAKYYGEKAYTPDCPIRQVPTTLAVISALLGDEENEKKYIKHAVKNGQNEYLLKRTIEQYKDMYEQECSAE